MFGFRTVEIHGDGLDAHGKPVIVGYDVVVDQDQAKMVERVFRMFTDGQGLHRIARIFNDEHLPYPRKGGGNDGGGWSHTTVRAILRNERYAGRFV